MRRFKSKDYTVKAQGFPNDIWEVRFGEYFRFKLPDHVFRAFFEPVVDKPPEATTGKPNRFTQTCFQPCDLPDALRQHMDSLDDMCQQIETLEKTNAELLAALKNLVWQVGSGGITANPPDALREACAAIANAVIAKAEPKPDLPTYTEEEYVANMEAFTAGLNCSTGITAELLAALKELLKHHPGCKSSQERVIQYRGIQRAEAAIAKAAEALK